MAIERTPIDLALADLLKACGLAGESGTEQLYLWLAHACDELIDVIPESHAEGLCYDMNAALSGKLAEYIEEERIERRKMGH